MSKPLLVQTGSDGIPTGIKQAVEMLSEYSVPMYVYKKDSKLEQIGTAFVLCRNNRRFLVTAGHCMRTILAYNRDPQYSAAVVLAIETTNYTIARAMSFMITDDKSDPTSTLDIGTLDISTGFDFSERAKSVEICSSRAFCHPLPSNRVSVSGFPNKLNKNPISTIEADIVDGGIQAHVTYPLDLDFDLARIGKHPTGHAAISWPSKNIDGNMIGQPRGLSGAPVWCMPHSPSTVENPDHAVMVGVFIEYHKPHKIAVYTRASQLIRFIDHAYFRNTK